MVTGLADRDRGHYRSSGNLHFTLNSEQNCGYHFIVLALSKFFFDHLAKERKLYITNLVKIREEDLAAMKEDIADFEFRLIQKCQCDPVMRSWFLPYNSFLMLKQRRK